MAANQSVINNHKAKNCILPLGRSCFADPAKGTRHYLKIGRRDIARAFPALKFLLRIGPRY
jgi:hypothetical protein